MSSHAKAAKKFIADRERTAWHDQACFLYGKNEIEWLMMSLNGKRYGKWQVI